MGSLVIASMVLGFSYMAALVGMLLHARLPKQHLDAESREVVTLVMGLVATMAALVLGLLVASANTSHDGQNTQLKELSADMILLDRTLALYGPDAQSVRHGMAEVARHTHDAIWSPAGVRPQNLNSAATQNATRAKLIQFASLPTRTDMERTLKGRAFEQADSIAKSRLLMFEGLRNQTSWLFLGILMFWISVLFLGFGLLAQFNTTVAVTQFLGALSVAGAIFLILELSQPYRGLLRISDEPLRAAIAQLDR